ncbi:DNA-dependent metalloprotease SPRTN isoform X2 [Rhinoraja longicauda]
MSRGSWWIRTRTCAASSCSSTTSSSGDGFPGWRCAGVCSYEGRGGLCSIRISEPLMKLRPRRDLVETLLHEMIHALLFVTNNDRDHQSHGPEFCKHMRRINGVSGTNISIYHSFHDEVDEYRQHWWRCDGPCQNRKPYYGYVKRAMNRAPSAQDPWWHDHQQTCGGTYTKVKEPENYTSKKAKTEGTPEKLSKTPKDKDKSMGADIRTILPFSGRGHVLGGNSPSTALQRVSLGRTPESLLTPSSHHVSWGSGLALKSNGQKAAKKTSSSSNSSLSDSWSPSVSSGRLLKRPRDHPSFQPVKRSVSNDRAFISIDGSPVRTDSTNLVNSVKKKVPNYSTKGLISELHQPPLQRDRKMVWPDTSFPRGTILHAFGKSTAERQRGQSSGASTSSMADSENWHGQKSASTLPPQMGAPADHSGVSGTVNCPACRSTVLASEINQHLDLCLH